MSMADDIFQQIQALPEGKREELFAMLHVAPTPEPVSDDEVVEGFVYDPANPMLGLLRDEPGLADEILRMAMHDRETRPWRTSE